MSVGTAIVKETYIGSNEKLDGWYCRKCNILIAKFRPTQCSKCDNKTEFALKTFTSCDFQIDCIYGEWMDMYNEQVAK
jgi:hypothetical protein